VEKTNIIGIDGKPLRKSKGAQKVPVVEFDGFKFLVREMNTKADLEQFSAGTLAHGILTQISDRDRLLWAGLLALARDIYQRKPDGRRNFQEFADSVGLILSDGEKTIDVAKELRKV
jgi:hypothetical protein